MGNFLGARHWIGFKPQAVPGTAEATVTTFLATESMAMNAKPSAIERKTHVGTGRALPGRKGYIKPENKCTAELMASQPQPFFWALGAVTSTQPAVSTDPTVYLHTITESADGPVNLTVEGDKVYAKAKQADAKINKLTLTGQTGEVARIALEGLALTHTEPTTLTSVPVYVDDVLTVMAASIKIAGQPDLTIDNFEIAWEEGLEQLPTIEDADGAPHVVRPKDIVKVTGKLKFIDMPSAELARLMAAEVFSLETEMDGTVISNSYKQFARVTLPACQYTGGLDADISDSVITGEADFAAYYDTVTGHQSLVEFQNTVSTIND